MNKPLLSAASAAARFGLVAFFGVGLAAAQTAPSTTTNKDEPQKLEKFVVTGSLIPIAAGSPAIPVTVIDAAEIERTGVSTDLLDVLRKSEPAFYGANNVGS